MGIGLRAHDAGKDTSGQLARKIAAAGFQCVQLTLEEAVVGMEAIAGRLSPGLAWSVGMDFRNAGVQIAVLSCYFNMMEENPAALGRSVADFHERLRYARDFGCGIVATETGSLNADFSFHPENHGDKAFEKLLPTLQSLVREAERFGVIVCIEAVWKYAIHDPESTKRMLDAIPSNNLQILFDPVNMASPDNFGQLDDLITGAFSLYGERIAVLHLKDYVIENGKTSIVPLGRGLLNIPLLLRLAREHKPGINIILEEMDFAGAKQNLRYLQENYGDFI